MRILIAPQEFKGSLSAADAARAIAEGLRRAHPDWRLDLLPMSDGGPGFIDAMRAAGPSDMAAVAVQDALGRRVLARYLVTRQPRVAIVEAAQANGLLHLQPGQRDALHADSYGVGEIVREALRASPERLVVGVGGSATTDGGAGMARALGARFTGMAGRELPPGGASLADLARIDWQRPAALDGVDIVVATDVTNPLLGPNGAAAVYGPQKGASAGDVDALEAALWRYAAVIRRSLGVDIGTIAGGGAAGGLAAGMVAFLGARIESGFDVVATVNRLEERLAEADIVVTGEGSFDGQSVQGKTTGRIRDLAAANGRPCVIFAGRAEAQDDNVRTLQGIEPDDARAMANAAPLLAALAATWAASV